MYNSSSNLHILAVTNDLEEFEDWEFEDYQKERISNHLRQRNAVWCWKIVIIKKRYGEYTKEIAENSQNDPRMF